MREVTVSAPGKLMLFGEHAVVYGHPCIVTAVDQRLHVTLTKTSDNSLHINAPDVDVTEYKKPLEELGEGDIPKGAKFIEIAVKNVFDNQPEILRQVQIDKSGIKIQTRSDFSSTFGFGSSSASTVGVVKALSELFEKRLSEKEIFDISYKTVLDIQGAGSGFDIAAAVYGGTLYFVTGGEKIEPLDVFELPLIVGYSGVKADTTEMIKQVAKSLEENKKQTETIFKLMSKVVNRAKKAILANDYETLGVLMNQNQEYLFRLGVSTEMLNSMISKAVETGAYGAKLSGAGGGDCMVALVSDQKREKVERVIKNVGGEVLSVKTNAEGVSVEK